MATVRQTIALNDKMSKALSSINKAMHTTLNTMKAVKAENVGVSFDAAEKAAREADRALAEFNSSLQDTNENSTQTNSSLQGTIGKFITLAAVVTAAKKAMDLTDTLVSNQARLDLAIEQIGAGEDLVAVNNEIYKSAQRSRTIYTDMQASVAKLGLTASKSFDSTAEIIRFTELLNKNFVVGGASQTEQASAMYQLTQAMGSGKLQGDEYRSIIENAPLLAKAIEDYMRNVQKAKGSMKEWASEGLLTADVIKAALFSSADNIEKRFAEMPLTFAQAWTGFKNAAVRAFEPVTKILSKVLQGLTFVFEYLAESQSVIYALAMTIGIAGLAWISYNTILFMVKLTTDMTFLSTVALYTALGMVLVGIFALSFGILQANEGMYDMMLIFDALTAIMMLFQILDMKLWDSILTGVENVTATILMDIQMIINAVITLANTALDAISAITGLEMGSFEEVTFASDYALKNAEKQAQRDEDIQNKTNEYLQFTAEADANFAQRQKEREENERKLAELERLIGTDANGGKALKTTSNDNLLSDEDVQMLLDIATRDYQLSYQSVTPNISVTFGDVRETADVDGVMDAIAGRIDDIINGDAEVSE